MTERLKLLLWLAGFLGNGLLFLVLIFRGHRSTYPVFTTLAAYEALRTFILYRLSHAALHPAYVKTYWSSEAIDVVLQIALLYETGRQAFLSRTYSGSTSSRPLSSYMVAIAMSVAAICSMAVPPVNTLKDTVDMRACLFTSLLTCELYLLILARVNRFRLRRSGHTTAIFNGITLWAICAVLSDVIHQIRGWEKQSLSFDEFKSVIVVLMLFYWIVIFFRPSARVPDEYPVRLDLPLTLPADREVAR